MPATSLPIKTLVLSTALLASSAWSATLTTSGDYALSGTTYAAEPQLGGVVLEDMISDFSISGAGETLEGTIQNRVVRSDLDGTLDFYWRIRPTAGNGDLLAFRLSNFDAQGANAEWRTDGLGSIAPTTARYFGAEDDAVNFLFEEEEVGVDAESYFFFLDTDAVNYDMSGSFDLLCANSGCVSSSYATFAPTEVPLPAGAWLFGSGLVALFGAARRQKA